MKNKKILIIDDEKDFTDMIKLNLEARGGYEVMTENEGFKALASARRFKPDLILLDVIIRDKDGGAVRHELKKDKATEGIPIVFLTATANAAGSQEDDGMVGGYVFLAKPITMDALVSSIEKELNKTTGG